MYDDFGNMTAMGKRLSGNGLDMIASAVWSCNLFWDDNSAYGGCVDGGLSVGIAAYPNIAVGFSLSHPPDAEESRNDLAISGDGTLQHAVPLQVWLLGVPCRDVQEEERQYQQMFHHGCKGTVKK